MKTYPINLVGLENKPCLVIGGGRIAERRALSLVEAGARPTVISPEVSRILADLQSSALIEHISRPFHPNDLQDAYLIIVATDNNDVNRKIGELARHHVPLINVVDDPELSTFTMASILRRGDFVVSISTGGAAPALAARVREQLETDFGSEYALFVAWCGAIRPVMGQIFSDPDERRARWYALMDSSVLDLLANGRVFEARALAAQILGPEVTENLPPRG